MQSIRNFRDLGNIKGRFGKVKPKKLLRGGPLYDINQDDLINLTNHHNLKTVVDFRNKHERDFEPNVVLDGVKTLNLLVMADKEEEKTPSTSQTTSSDFMYDIYREFVLSDRSLKTYKTFIETIAQRSNEGSIYFHCTAGKDRTGFAAALILKLLGVSDEDIFKDFLETNKNIEKDKASLLKSIQTFHPFDETDENLLYDVLGVQRAYLEASFDIIQEKYGNFDNFIKDGLNIDQITIETLKANLLE